MKRLTTLCAAVLMAAMSFAAVEYVLPAGAVTNDYGWTGAADMYKGLNQDWNTYSGSSNDWGDCTTFTEVAQGLPSLAGTMDLSFMADATISAKWQWLWDYLDAVCADQGQTISSSNASYFRYNINAFFINGVRSSWPVSANYTTCGVGTYSAYAKYWKHGFDNPTEVTETFVLNAPYLEGMTFDGWYTEDEGQGDKVTTIDETTTGKLYAYFVPYINTVGEVLAMEDGTNDVKVKGVVTFIQGDTGPNFWIQDATGGIFCYGPNHGLTEGEEVVLQGQKNTYRNSPELNNAVVLKHETATYTPVAVSVTLADINSADTRYLNQLVYIEGLKMKEYQNAGSYYNPVVTDGVIDMILYNMGVEESVILVGTKVNVQAIVSVFDETMQLRGKTEWVEYAIPAAKDTYNYPVRGAEEDFAGYTLKNEWIFANTYDNYL